jgi:HEAT repeat protein
MHPSEDQRSVEQLLHAARDPACLPDSDEYWAAAWALQFRLEAGLFGQLRLFARSREPRDRILVADVLAQGYVGDKRLRDECIGTLLEMLRDEDLPSVLIAIGNAFGHLHAVAAVEPLAKFSQHPEPAVRLAIVHGLLCQEAPLAIQTLIELSADKDRDVRNWATFGLGSQLEADSAVIRDALMARVSEADDEISGEAIVGLAKRGDIRVVQPLLDSIQSVLQENLEFGTLIFEAADLAREAAAKSSDPHWQPLIRRLDELGLGETP